MTVDIVVPQVGEAVAEVTIVRWLKAVGDTVEKGEVVFEVDTDKSVIEVEAFESGVLAEILAKEGAAVMPQDVVARLETDESALSNDDKQGEQSTTHNGEPGAGPQRSAHSELQPSGDLGDHREQSNRPSRGIIRATPKARASAKALGVSLADIDGSGPNGLITHEDIERSHRQYLVDRREKTVQNDHRHLVAEATARSKREVPHYYLQRDIDMSNANLLRQLCTPERGWEKPPTYTDIVVKAAALALKRRPAVNISYAPSGELISRSSISIGIAIAVERGLRIGVVHDADSKNLQQVSRDAIDIVGRARQGRQRSTDTGEKSLVVTNLGMYGVDVFFAIIDIPDPMIVAVGRVRDQVVSVDGNPAVRPIATISLSVDHRALNGADAAMFLSDLKKAIEQCEMMVP